ncbi:MAG: helix-turn-helix domain-containing protein, partial [Bacteroidetes bacterium]|nr:helix-turn-helix domain-containing protein [Bacteroidota bacterium]
MLRILHINLPEQMLLTVGPLLYLYVLKITQREYQFKRRDLLHLSPLAFVVAPTPVLQILIFVSVMAYLYLADQLIQKFYKGLQPVLMDRSLLEFRWLRRLLGATALLWVLWLASELGVPVYGSVYIFFAVMIIWMAAAAFLRPQAGIVKQTPAISKSVPPELKGKGIWLKKTMESDRYYLDSELSLTSMAEKLGLTTHELSQIVNTGLKKSFADFVNGYRVHDAAAKMQDPEFDHLTLLGIAYESGFNSQRTFNRAFKDVTGKTPLEYKNDLKKVLPYDKMAKLPASPPLILRILNRNFMFRNYLKIAWRHLTSNKLYSTINVMGLALGICACLVIYLITSFEFSFDTFHPDKERIYCVDVSVEGNPDPDHAHWNAVPAPMPDAMRSEMSGFEKVAAFQHYNPKVKIKEGNKVLKSFDQTNGIIAQSDYFDIMSYTWLSGNKRTSLSKP